MTPRKKPTRTCVACRNKSVKQTMVRVVRLPDNAGVVIDTTGKVDGRGAYLCAGETCINLAFKKGALGRSLKCPIPTLFEHTVRAHFAKKCSNPQSGQEPNLSQPNGPLLD